MTMYRFDNTNFSPRHTWYAYGHPTRPWQKTAHSHSYGAIHMAPSIWRHSWLSGVRSILLNPFHHFGETCFLTGKDRYLRSVFSDHNSVSSTFCRLTELLFYLDFDIISPRTRGNNLWQKECDHELIYRSHWSQNLEAARVEWSAKDRCIIIWETKPCGFGKLSHKMLYTSNQY